MASDASIEIEALDAPLGGEVRGIDLSDERCDQAASSVVEALDRHMLLIFRDQRLDEAAHLRVSRWFGEPVQADDQPFLGNNSQQVRALVSNQDDGVFGDGEIAFHSDNQFLPNAACTTLLYAEAIPSTGGETSWSNLYQAWDELDEATRRRIERMRMWAFNPYMGPRAIRSIAGPNQKYEATEERRAMHSVAPVHPATGRRSLYVSALSGGLIDAAPASGPFAVWSRYRNRRLLQQLKRHIDQPRYYYTHRWRSGDFVIWDNRCTNHKRASYPSTEQRRLYRVCVQSEPWAR